MRTKAHDTLHKKVKAVLDAHEHVAGNPTTFREALEDLKEHVNFDKAYFRDKPDTEDAVEVLFDTLNNCGFGRSERQKFCELAGRQHRCLQQTFTDLCFAWIGYLAEQEYFDGRNEYSVRRAKLVKKLLTDAGEADMLTVTVL